MTYEEAQEQQRLLCRQEGCIYHPSESDSILGLAIATIGKLPVTGLRRMPLVDANGWHVWCGDHPLAYDDFLRLPQNFFSHITPRELIAHCPEAVKFLGLPPGYRFLVAGDHIDIWYDGDILGP